MVLVTNGSLSRNVSILVRDFVPKLIVLTQTTEMVLVLGGMVKSKRNVVPKCSENQDAIGMRTESDSSEFQFVQRSMVPYVSHAKCVNQGEQKMNGGLPADDGRVSRGKIAIYK